MSARHLGLHSLALAAALAAAGLRPAVAHAAGVYFVKEGDSLEKVARVFAADASRIRALNGLRREIRPGDRLRIPDPEPAPPAPPAPPSSLDARLSQLACREETVYHVVERGDTLAAIGRRYGSPLADLLAMNNLRPSSILAIGRRVVVRRSGPRTHVVRRGDTLYRIATRNGLAVADLRRLNGLADDRIAPGRRLVLEPCDAPQLAAGIPGAPAASAPAAAAEPTGPFPAPGAEPGTPDPTLVDRVVGLARTMLDIPYRFGGTTLRGIDCSAYVQRVFGLADTPLPRTAREQFRIGAPVRRDDLTVGDLVFFRTYAAFPSHVGIYLGDNLFIHASSVVRKVTIDSIDRPYYLKRFIGARRILGDGAPNLAAAAR